MSSIQASSLGHSTIALTKASTKVVIDPGVLAPEGVLSGSSAVLITHDHADHLNAQLVASEMRANAHLRVWGPATSIAQLTELGADANRLATVRGGDVFNIDEIKIEVLGENHAPIHSAFPPSENNAYLIDGEVLHTGDTLPEIPRDTSLRVLLLPIAAPWLRLEEAINYAARLKPEIIVPIHDGVLSDAGKMLTDRIMSAVPNIGEYRRLAPGEIV